MTDISKLQMEYAKKQTVQKSLQLNRTTDSDILDVVSDVKNFQGYVKALIRADVAGQGLYKGYRQTAARQRREEFQKWLKKFLKDMEKELGRPHDVEDFMYERDNLIGNWLADYMKGNPVDENKASAQYTELYRMYELADDEDDFEEFLGDEPQVDSEKIKDLFQSMIEDLKKGQK